MAAATQVVSMLIDQLCLVCGMLCKFMTCLLCFYQKQFLGICSIIGCGISSSPAMLFDGGEALCYLDCCSICITTIIICMYLIRIVISFIWVTGIFSSLLWFNLLNKKSDSVAKTHAWIVSFRDKERPHNIKLITLKITTT